MTYVPQFDPDRPASAAEDFDNGVEGAVEAFVDWLYHERHQELVDYVNNTGDPIIMGLVQKWSDSDV